MKLNVPVVRQEKDSLDCGLACLSMLFTYYSINRSISDLKKNIKVYDRVGTYIPQLGKYLLDNGFEVEIITINPHLFTKKLTVKSQKELINYFDEIYTKTEKENSKEILRYFKEFISMGGKLNVKVPTVGDIKEEISNNRPLFASLTSNFLLFDKAIFNFHYNLIIGVDKDYIYVNDPMWDYRGGTQKYTINDYMYAIYATAYGDLDNASIMKVKPK